MIWKILGATLMVWGALLLLLALFLPSVGDLLANPSVQTGGAMIIGGALMYQLSIIIEELKKRNNASNDEN